MPSSIRILGIDADDTLWQNEELFRLTQDLLTDMLAPYASLEEVHNHLMAAERRNLGCYGYGIKSFTLSMVETAINVSQARVPAHVVYDILKIGRDMLNHPIRLLPGVADSLPQLAETYKLILITKGDLLHQEQKLEQSGLKRFFNDIQIVSEKQTATYSRIFGAHVQVAAMIGNSIKSDILPALNAGATAIHVPAYYEWHMEKAEEPTSNLRYFKVLGFKNVQELLAKI